MNKQKTPTNSAIGLFQGQCESFTSELISKVEEIVRNIKTLKVNEPINDVIISKLNELIGDIKVWRKKWRL